ncbi:amidohydrolase family protein [Nitratireductor mangrovi]|uniref:Amidohydrolase family protein n=1 Tax=Nitratireductor mangrovi TaxID=2599600 RepID=A0A5B8L480_9HYPH|nr:amidohydrolase family protein [Nitratireductor mangrovi]QDZ02378.1 amidohydrolase family protein [Nitratireductor mangrovi]
MHLSRAEDAIAAATRPDPDYLPFHPAPARPQFRMPDGAVDAHCHVFGPAALFPFSASRRYTPVDAPAERLFALRDHLGISRNVIVQATCHGTDNSAMLDAIARSNGQARGVAVIDADTPQEELWRIHDGGVRGVRLNFLKRLVGDAPRDDYIRIAERVAALGWHIVVYFESAELSELGPYVEALPGTIVIDHMGRPDVADGLGGRGFARVLELMASNPRFWIKVSCPERLTVDGPPYGDVVPFARTLVERFPDRTLWGTDWPHPNMTSHMPDDGALVDLIPQIAPSPELQKRLLVDNPMRLYWPGERAP